MKKLLLIIVTLCTITLGFSQTKGFEKGNMYHQIGVGGQNYWRISAPGRGAWWNFADFTTQYQAEWGIHDYVGLGFHAGITAGGFRGTTSLYVPLGVQANFHFYQLIDDKVSSDIKSEKLDIYAGVNVGAGPAFITSTGDVFGGVHAGPQVGVRFYPKSNIGMFAEVGYGKSFAQFGLVIR